MYRLFLKSTGTFAKKSNSKASGWELHPRPWISSPTLYRQSHRSRCRELVHEFCIYVDGNAGEVLVYIKGNIWQLHSLSTDRLFLK